MRTLDIGWCYTETELEIGCYEPEPVYDVYKNINSAFKVCPAIKKYLENF